MTGQPSMTGQLTVLAALLEDRGLQRYGAFRAAYEKAARTLDEGLWRSAPSRAQFHRWRTGHLRALPYTDHCRVLESMLAGYSARELFQPCPDGLVPAPVSVPPPGRADPAAGRTDTPPGMADVTAVFASRSEFAGRVDPQALFAGASWIRAAGLSLNIICQQVPDQQLRRLLAEGTRLSCLFLDPDSESMRSREREEEYPPGHLAGLTSLNIQIMARLRDHLPGPDRDRVQLAVYDETIRFNIILVDDHICVAQPYLPHARGIDSPTLLINRGRAPGGLYPIFEQVYDSLQERCRPL
jgi:hypothetical protein